jgi:hypothetical protein
MKHFLDLVLWKAPFRLNCEQDSWPIRYGSLPRFVEGACEP